MSQVHFDAAVMAHMAWLARFQSVMTGISRERFDADQIADHTICDFGRWLYANPGAFADAAAFESVCDLHRRFHAQAARIAEAFRFNEPSRVLAPMMRGLEDLSAELVDALYEANAAQQ